MYFALFEQPPFKMKKKVLFESQKEIQRARAFQTYYSAFCFHENSHYRAFTRPHKKVFFPQLGSHFAPGRYSLPEFRNSLPTFHLMHKVSFFSPSKN